MPSYSDLFKEVTVKFSKQINKSCCGLFDAFGINQFYYCRISNDGFFSNLDSNLHWADYFTSEHLYLTYPYFSHPKYLEPGISLIREAPHEELNGVVLPRKEKFNFQLWLRIVHKTLNGIEEFGFSSGISSDDQATFFLNEVGFFNLFAENFKKENAYLVRSLDDCKINIGEIIGPCFHQNRTPVSKTKAAKLNFLKKIGMEGISTLSLIEIKIIKLMLNGFSANESASQIFRSKRTVEHHIERIKEKLGCSSKLELIQKGNELLQFGFLN